MRAVIICGGNVGEYILEYVDKDDCIICADSGYDRAIKYGLSPDIIIGDMDSVKADFSSENTIVYPSRKDYTDSELVLDYAISNGFDKILMFGMTGTRMDHTYANISLLLKCRNADVVIIDENNEIRMLFDEIKIKGKIGDTVSILPFSSDLVGVTSKGLEYSLNNSTVKIGTSLGVSNKMTEEACTIEIKEGIALVIRSKD